MEYLTTLTALAYSGDILTDKSGKRIDRNQAYLSPSAIVTARPEKYRASKSAHATCVRARVVLVPGHELASLAAPGMAQASLSTATRSHLLLPPAALVHPCTSAAPGMAQASLSTATRSHLLLPPAALVHPCTSRSQGRNTGMRQGFRTVIKSTVQSRTRYRRSALEMTDTELKLMAAAAIMGESSRPNSGYSTPAASGTPSEL
jgi:hypothetical protein